MSEDGFKETARNLILIGTGATWVTILLLSVLSLFGVGMQNFAETSSKVLLPIFNTTIVALLAYVFGTPVSEGIRNYLNRKVESRQLSQPTVGGGPALVFGGGAEARQGAAQK